jgi:ribosomal protein S18 acetylase RimI-like enzyme
MTTRPAVAADRERIVDIATAAFVTEPAFTHFFGDDYEPHARSLLGYLLELRLSGGLAFVDDVEGVDGHVAAVSMWDPPGGLLMSKADRLARWQEVASTFPPDVVHRFQEYDERVHGFAPEQDHYYLGVIATDPLLHGRGHGAAVIRAGLALADDTALPAYLETGTERNVGYYKKFGFDVTAQLELSDGTRIWCLTREPVRQG